MMEFFSIDNWKVSKYRDITQSLEVVGRRRLCLERVDNEFKKKRRTNSRRIDRGRIE